jgi:hypothetical protein
MKKFKKMIGLMAAKLFCLAIIATAFVACSSNEPNSAFIGAWDPVGYEGVDIFYVSSDSIKAVQCSDGLVHYQSHYKMLTDKTAELERCWLPSNHEEGSDWNPELYRFAEVSMYIDKDGYLIIEPFDIVGVLAEIYPNYSNLKLKIHKNN